MDVFVAAVGRATPDLAVDAREIGAAWGVGGRGTVRACDHDEDSLTLAWEAGVEALAVAGLRPSTVGGLWWGTSRPPFAEGPSHAWLAAALGLDDEAEGALLSGSPHAGVEALRSAWLAVSAGAVDSALVIVSDALVPALGSGLEQRLGAGAVALVLGQQGTARLDRFHTSAAPTLDRYRGDRETATRDLYDVRMTRELVWGPSVGAEIECVVTGGTVDRWAVDDLDGRARRSLAKAAGIETLNDPLGQIGAATQLFAAVDGLTEAGSVAIVTTGGGRVTSLVLDADGPVPGADRPLPGARRTVGYPELLRTRGQLEADKEPVPMGVPPGSAMFARGLREWLGPAGARCVDCSTIAVPPGVHPSCLECGSDKLEVVPLATDGTVHTFAVNQAMPAPFIAPLPILIIDLDDGARIQAQGLTADEVAVGVRVRLVLRRLATERGAPLYGYKARVVAPSSDVPAMEN
ncbi:MAG TPA: OB-fold domain-containing protein [Nitriliruptorales bacterium]